MRAGDTKLNAARTDAQSMASENVMRTSGVRCWPCSPTVGVKLTTVGRVVSGATVVKVEVNGVGSVRPPSSKLVAPVPTRSVYVVPRASAPVLQRNCV